MSLHPGLGPRSVAGISDRAQRKATRFVERLAEGERWFSWGGLLQLFWGLLLLPISAAYLAFGRFFLAKLFFANPRCNGCGICADHCPNQAIRMWGRTNPRPYWTFSCESCMRCMGYCPHRAVEAGHSLGVLLYFATTAPVGVLALNALGRIHPELAALSGTPAIWLIQYPFALLSLFVCYLLFTLLIRIPLVNQVFTWTTFTRIRGWRRYREPGTGLKQLRQWTIGSEESGEGGEVAAPRHL
jgi:Pyruvate/2-oxoacid:ferredoxin oxidoreductase delta subunit